MAAASSASSIAVNSGCPAALSVFIPAAIAAVEVAELIPVITTRRPIS